MTDSLRQSLERKLRLHEQSRKRSSFASSLSGFSQDIDSELFQEQSPITTQRSDDQFSSTAKLSAEMEEEQSKLSRLQSSLAQRRLELLEASRMATDIEVLIRQEKQGESQDSIRMREEHQRSVLLIQNEGEARLNQSLTQIQALIAEKATMNQQSNKIELDCKKLNKLLQDQQQRHKLDLKNSRQAFLAIERDKSSKWEQQRVKQIKIDAIKETQPKLTAIITQSQADVREAKTKAAADLQAFKQQQSHKLEQEYNSAVKALQNTHSNDFEELRKENAAKQARKYNELQQQFDRDREAMRHEYSSRIVQIDDKVRKEIQEYLQKGKNHHDEHLKKMETMRAEQDANLAELKRTVNEQIKKQYNRQKEIAQANLTEEKSIIDQQNAQKLLKAQQKMTHKFAQKRTGLIKDLQKQSQAFRSDIDAKYQKLYLAEVRKVQAVTGSLREKLDAAHKASVIRQQMIDRHMQAVAERVQKKKQLLAKKQTLERKIKESQQLCRSREAQQKETLQEMETEARKAVQLKANEFKRLNQELISLQKQLDERQDELLRKYHVERDKCEEQVAAYKEEIEQLLAKKNAEIKKLRDELVKIKKGNDAEQALLDQERELLTRKGP